jgi:hypothetical protein
VVTLLIGTVLAWFMALPDIRSVEDYRPQVATLILDRRNRPIDAIAKEFRVLVPFAGFPASCPRPLSPPRTAGSGSMTASTAGRSPARPSTTSVPAAAARAARPSPSR